MHVHRDGRQYGAFLVLRRSMPSIFRNLHLGTFWLQPRTSIRGGQVVGQGSEFGAAASASRVVS
jgi:hypothetical protein